MSEKKKIVVVTKPQEVEIEANLISNDELRETWLNVRGGNADKDNAELMRYLATSGLVKDTEIIRSLHYRAARLDDAFEQIKGFIWPKDKADEVLALTHEPEVN